jgi:hypothetical protein
MKKTILAAVFILPLLLMLGLIYHAKTNPRISTKQDPKVIWEKKWASGSFSDITNTLVFQELVGSSLSNKLASIKGETEKQKTELQKSIFYFLVAYNSGDYSNYTRFRFPIVEGQFSTNHINEFLGKIKRIPQYTEGLQTNDMFAVVHKLWETYGLMGKFYCTTCWRSVDLASFEILEASPVTWDTIGNISVQAQARPNVGSIMVFNPMFLFSPSETDILGRNTGSLSTTITLNIKEQDGVAYPVYIQYYWVEEAQKWLPTAMAFGYWHENICFLF